MEHSSNRTIKELLYSLRRNVAYNVNTFVKLGLYKSILLPVLTYGCHCANFLRKNLQKLEFFQKKVVKWVCGKHCQNYTDQLRMLNILPLPMFLQTNDLLLLSKLCTDYEHDSIPLPTANNTLDRRLEPFKLPKTRTEKRRGEFVFRTTRVANRIDHLVNFRIEQVLKQRITILMWKFYSEKYSDRFAATAQRAKITGQYYKLCGRNSHQYSTGKPQEQQQQHILRRHSSILHSFSKYF